MISIIGGGISGLTTGLTLQLLGYETEIFAEHLVGDFPLQDPRFASYYPAASVIPHSVQSSRVASLFSDSMEVYEALYNNKFPAMALHRHYEVFEFPVDEPEYITCLKRCNAIQDEDGGLIPCRAGVNDIFGWAFDCYVTAWPVYMKEMYALYREKGGIIHNKRVERDEISAIQSDVIINCTGVWSNALFDDDEEVHIIRGHLLRSPGSTKIKNLDGRICSYTYTPKPSVYATPDGDPCDVYFYPISSTWVIGGSRQSGRLSDDGKWLGKDAAATLLIDGIEVPRQIYELNAEILEHTYRQKLHPVEQLKAFIGYRYTRGDGEDNIRLERTEQMGKTIIHNYGHGGAGVALAWGCALEVTRLLDIDAKATDVIKELLS